MTAYRFDEHWYCSATKELRLRGTQVILEPRLAALLELFVANPGTTLRHEQLRTQIWGDEGSDEALYQAVSRLRKSLDKAELIRTVPRVGYVFDTTAEVVIADVSKPRPRRLSNMDGRARELRQISGGHWNRSWLYGFASGLLVGVVSVAALTLTTFEKQMEIEIEDVIDGKRVVITEKIDRGLLADRDLSVATR